AIDFKRECQPPRGCNANTDPGKRPGTDHDRNLANLCQLQMRLVENFIDDSHEPLGMTLADHVGYGTKRLASLAVMDCSRTIHTGRIDCQNNHLRPVRELRRPALPVRSDEAG